MASTCSAVSGPAGPDTAALARENRLESSRRKIRAPFVLDPTMCFYSPQANVEALTHPRVSRWLSFIEHEWTPTPVPGTRARLGLLLPCTKYKPYVTSREHRSINSGLLGAGWQPVHPFGGPAELEQVLDDAEPLDLLSTAPLHRDGVVLDRFVISEPLALVPYELTMRFAGEQSPATSYDDPGLFESRGTSVSPERPDCTASPRGDGTWRWGPAERAAFADMHNTMADVLAASLARIAGSYISILAWVSPGLTHRSFLADSDFRRGDGLPSSRTGPDGRIGLRGARDSAPGLRTVVDILPTREQIDTAKTQLAARLGEQGRRVDAAAMQSVFARGDGHDTPLGLPELVTALVSRLDSEAVPA